MGVSGRLSGEDWRPQAGVNPFQDVRKPFEEVSSAELIKKFVTAALDKVEGAPVGRVWQATACSFHFPVDVSDDWYVFECGLHLVFLHIYLYSRNTGWD